MLEGGVQFFRVKVRKNHCDRIGSYLGPLRAPGGGYAHNSAVEQMIQLVRRNVGICVADLAVENVVLTCSFAMEPN